MKIVLISCSSKKQTTKSKAKDLYQGPLFKLNLAYAKSLNPDKIFILSAKYNLLNLNDEIEPYDLTLNNMNDKELQGWAEEILDKLKNISNLKEDKFIILAGENYRKYLVPKIKNYSIPLKGLGIGKQLKWLKEKSKTNNCEKIHLLFNNLKRFKFPFNDEDLPKNGIYILFEKGEEAHDVDRIVRVGTHTGDNNLRSRLKEHFIKEVKDRSIFRKNIGRCLLKGDPFLKDWELTPLIREVREKHPNIDFKKQKQVEKEVSDYIQKNFNFVVIPIEDRDKRLELESKIISTISLCKDCKPSKNWLGLSSPKDKIREGGYGWLMNYIKNP